MHTFEEILQIINDLQPQQDNDLRSVEWCDPENSIAVAKQSDGKIEIFICCDRIQPRSQIIAGHLEHDPWMADGKPSFDANRLVLPPYPHFDQVAAFLITELLTNLQDLEMLDAFYQAEPVIEMALRRTALSEQEIIGLMGELRLLEIFLRTAQTTEQKATCLSSWNGFRRASRDFEFEATKNSIEVKATRYNRSRHQVSNLKQVDPERNTSGVPIENLYLFSVRIQVVSPGQSSASTTLPLQVDKVLKLLGPNIDPGNRNAVQELFLQNLALYGGTPGCSYLHDDVRNAPAYSIEMTIGFQRVYNMMDSRLSILRPNHVAEFEDIFPQSVTYELNLPNEIDGDVNPETDISAFAERIIGQAFRG